MCTKSRTVARLGTQSRSHAYRGQFNVTVTDGTGEETGFITRNRPVFGSTAKEAEGTSNSRTGVSAFRTGPSEIVADIKWPSLTKNTSRQSALQWGVSTAPCQTRTGCGPGLGIRRRTGRNRRRPPRTRCASHPANDRTPRGSYAAPGGRRLSRSGSWGCRIRGHVARRGVRETNRGPAANLRARGCRCLRRPPRNCAPDRVDLVHVVVPPMPVDDWTRSVARPPPDRESRLGRPRDSPRRAGLRSMVQRSAPTRARPIFETATRPSPRVRASRPVGSLRTPALSRSDPSTSAARGSPSPLAATWPHSAVTAGAPMLPVDGPSTTTGRGSPENRGVSTSKD